MADSWDTRNTRWETLFDQAVGLAQDGCTSETLSILKRIRSWQHRQSRHGKENHNWHDAELLWLQGVILERAGQSSDAAVVWGRLARVYKEIARLGDSSFLPRCARCAERVLQFAPSWFAVAAQLRDRAGDQDASVAGFRTLALGTNHEANVGKTRVANSGQREPSIQDSRKSSRSVDSSPSNAKLKAKRETIRRTYRELEQPATLVEMCEQYLKHEPTDGAVGLVRSHPSPSWPLQ